MTRQTIQLIAQLAGKAGLATSQVPKRLPKHQLTRGQEKMFTALVKGLIQSLETNS